MFRRTIAIILLILASCTLDAAPGIAPLIRFNPGQNVFATDATSDAQGHVYLCGLVKRGASLPGNVVVRGSSGTNEYDAFVIKLRADGRPLTTLVLSGNGYDIAERIAADSHGNVVIYGYSGSTDFPTVNALYPTAASAYSSFVCKLDPSLTNIVFSTFLNGTGTRAMTVDRDDNILLAGIAGGGPGLFPDIAPQTSDTFFLKLAPNGTNILYSTLLGVRNSADVTALAVDSSGVAHAVGSSGAADFPLVNALLPFKPAPEGYANAFLVRIGAAGALLSSTFIGGNCSEQATAVAVNEAGEIYVAGSGLSDVLPATAEFGTAPCGTSKKGFLLKLGVGATNVLYSKQFAFSGNDQLSAVVTTPDDEAIVGGSLSGSGYDGGVPFLARVAPDGSSTSFVPRDCGTAQSITRLALHPSGRIVVSGFENNGHALNLGSFVALADLERLEQKPELHLVSPKSFSVIGTNEPLQLVALATGFTDEIESVTFHEGKTLLGTATNAPYSIQVSSLTRGTHTFIAVAHTAQRRVSSCAVVVKARSPRNDHFVNRIQLTGPRVSVRGDTAGATSEPGETYYPYNHSVWYSWRAPRDGAFEFSLSQDSLVSAAVMLGNSVTTLQTIAYCYPQTTATVRCERGQTYHIRIANFDSVPTAFRIQIRPVTPPANDDFENALPISGTPALATGDFLHATRQTGEPGYGDTIWYSWTAPASGLYLASTTNGAADLEVYTGPLLTNLVSQGQRIYGLITGSAFYAEAGETYFLSASRADVPFQFTLSIEPHLPPPNDAFANRMLVPAGTLSATGTCIGATAETGEAQSLYNPTHSVWFKWTAPSSSVYRVSARVPYPPTPSLYGAGLTRPGTLQSLKVYRGDAVETLTLVSSFQYGSDINFWRAEAGVEYQVSISGGAAFFTLELEPVPPPANDDFANAELLNGFSPARGTLEGASVEPEEPEHNGYFNSKASVWYRWTAPSNGLFKVESSEAVQIYAGATLSTLVPVALAGANNLFRAEAGTVFSLAVFDRYSFSAASFTLRVRPAFPPPNDDFANAIALEGFDFTFVARTHDATSEPGESFNPRSSVWFSWTAPTNGGFVLRSTNVSAANLSVYTGDSLSNLVFVAESYSSTSEFNARTGEKFYFAVSGLPWSSPPDFLVELIRYPVPPNDNFTNAIVLTGTNVSISVTNLGASVETNEPTMADLTAQRSVWYSWTAPRTGRTSFIADGNFLPAINVFTGDRLTNLVEVRPFGLDSRFNVPVEAGVTYRISIDGYYYYGSGVAQLDIHYATPPPNDNFAERWFLTNGVGAGTLEAAARELSEPDYDIDPFGSSVWWTFTASSNGVHHLQLAGSDFSPRLGVYRGDTLESLEPAITGQAYDARFTAEAGVPVVIQLAGLNGTFGTYTLTVEYEPAPTNDLFASRVAFTNSVRGTLRGATVEPGEPNHQTGEGASVWWNWTAPRSGAFEIKIVDSDYGYELYGIVGRLFIGTNLAQLQQLPSAPMGYYSRWIHADEGTTYAVSVDAPQLTYEKFLLSMIYHEGPANDFFTNRIALAGSGLSITGSTLYATSEPDEYGGLDRSVWYSWVPPSSGTAVFQTDYSTQLDIFLGSSVTNLVRLGGTFLDANSVTLPVSASEEYKLRIVPAHGTIFYGPHMFTLTVTNTPAAPAPSPPSNIAARRALLITLPAEGSVIETSTNLMDWQPWWTNRGGTRMSIPVGEEPQRFFRAL